jgi:uncharacterized membrane protein YphA (DoxX/SURF4 family)
MSTNVLSSNDRAASRGQTPSISIAGWRYQGIGILRIIFGIVWAIDGAFKWAPEFVNNFASYVSGVMADQPAAVQAWLKFWVDVIQIDPHVFAHFVAVAETALAVALILGLFSNLAYLGGVLLSIVIWSTAEGFGGPYRAGSTDIGAAIIYVLVFVGLYLSQAGLALGLDKWLTPLLGRWGWLASGPVERA